MSNLILNPPGIQPDPKYFYRIAPWHWFTDSMITIIALPKFITLDPWPQKVFLDATGNLTVKEYIEQVAKQYDGKIPAELDDTIIYQLDQLLDLKVIALADMPQALSPDRDKPKDLNDKKALRQHLNPIAIK